MKYIDPVLIIGPNGRLKFALTSRMLRYLFDDFVSFKIVKQEICEADFGIGTETAFKCCKCGRYTPAITASVDHIIPKTKISFKAIDGIYDPDKGSAYICGDIVKFYKTGQLLIVSPHLSEINRYDYTIDNGYMYIGNRHFYMQSVVENLINNLQLMCSYCNSLKGNRV